MKFAYIVSSVSIIITLYTVCRLILPLKIATGWKVAISLLALLVSQQRLINRTFFGVEASPELPFEVLVVQGALYTTLILTAIFALLRDIVSLCLCLTRRVHGLSPALSASGKLTLCIGVLALGLSVFGVFQAVRVPDVERVEIRLANLPPALDEMRIVQLTDTHASKLLQRPWMQGVVDRVNALEPDLIVLTGDLLDGTPANRWADVLPLGDLKAKHGVISVTGNHEYFSNYDVWMPKLASLGFLILANEHTIITHKGTPLAIAGITDRVASRYGMMEPDVAAAIAGIPEATFTILLAHQPMDSRKNATHRVDLQLSGHTHGGQIIGLHLLSKYANNGFIYGTYDLGTMQLYVSKGTGLWNGFPVRIGIPSEITEITLRTKK